MINSQRRAFALSWMFVAASAGGAAAASGPIGTWVDHSGEGAVEIVECGGKLCGRIVWLKNAANQETCNLQVIGNAKPSNGAKWDGGWIYDPESKSKYDVEITPTGEDRLRVFGYAGMRMFGETMIWTRAPGDLKRCDAKMDAKSAAVPAAPPALPPIISAVEQAAVVGVPVPTVIEPVESPSPTPLEANAEAPRTAAQPKLETKRPAVVASKSFKFDDLKLDAIEVRKINNKCDVTIKDLGSFNFDC